jgi:hypothetical protein
MLLRIAIVVRDVRATVARVVRATGACRVRVLLRDATVVRAACAISQSRREVLLLDTIVELVVDVVVVRAAQPGLAVRCHSWPRRDEVRVVAVLIVDEKIGQIVIAVVAPEARAREVVLVVRAGTRAIGGLRKRARCVR